MISRMLVLILGIALLNMGTAHADVIELTERNTVTLRGVVNDSSVSKAQVELLKKAAPGRRIYLVLDTPGGSVDAGNMLIETAKGLPGRIDTITVFAASMGFQIAQNLGERLIIESGTLMSHRGYAGAEGQIPGELVSRIVYYSDMFQRLDVIAAARMGIPVATYQHAIRDEYWTTGQRAVAQKAADRVVTIRCSPELTGTDTVTFETMFGPVAVTFSKCPLITSPLAVKFEGEAQYKTQAIDYVTTMLTDKASFVRKYIKK